MNKNSKIWVAGANGMVGKNLINSLKKNKRRVIGSSRSQCDLFKRNRINLFLKKNRPSIAVLCAAKVGGIYANNKYPVNFLLENLKIQINFIEACQKNKVEKIIFLGSSCIYPRNSKQPIKEEYLLSDYLEKTNEWYGIAKIAGLKLIEAYRKQYNCNHISLMPTNVYGKYDNFDDYNSHVIPGLINKISKAKLNKQNIVELWGTGKPLREFIYAEDLARAIIFAIDKYNDDKPINIGTGQEISIKSLAFKIKKIVGYDGKIIFNRKYPDGTPRKRLNINKLKKIGWKPSISLDKGLKETINWYNSLK